MPESNPRFLDYTPMALAFGTSGLRGLVEDITDLETYINIKGTLRQFLAAGDVAPGGTVVLAGDLRPSTARIMRAAAQAIVDSSLAIENAGTVPTPALVLHSISQGRAGVMITGSHIPFDRNGIKVNKPHREILKRDEAPILAEVARVRAEEYRRTARDSAFDASGWLKRPSVLPMVDGAAAARYRQRYREAFAPGALAGMRVVFYQHSAVGRDLLPQILADLGAEVIPAGRSDTFIPIDTENVAEDQLDRMEALVDEAERGSSLVDAIASTDGDSDRPLLSAVLREPGLDGRRVQFLSGDLLGLVVAEYLGAESAAVPISANDAIERRLAELGISLRRTRIGSPHVIVAMDAERATHGARRVVGWEANGGFLVGTDLSLRGRSLPMLASRDAVLPILANLHAAAESKLGLDALWARLPARHGSAGLLDGVSVTVGSAILAAIVPRGDVTEVDLSDDSVCDRSDAGSRELDGPAADGWRASKALLERFFTPALGFGQVVRINVLDGVRVTFAGGDVAHVRPSGNAPQLRIYANADTRARAAQIVAEGLREPEGTLRRMIRAFTPAGSSTPRDEGETLGQV